MIAVLGAFDSLHFFTMNFTVYEAYLWTQLKFFGLDKLY